MQVGKATLWQEFNFNLANEVGKYFESIRDLCSSLESVNTRWGTLSPWCLLTHTQI